MRRTKKSNHDVLQWVRLVKKKAAASSKWFNKYTSWDIMIRFRQYTWNY